MMVSSSGTFALKQICLEVKHYILGIPYSSMFDGLEEWGWGEGGVSLLFCLKIKEMPTLN